MPRLAETAYEDKYDGLNQWLHSELGLLFREAVSQQLLQHKKELTGDVVLQLGYCDHNWVQILNYSSQWLSAPKMDHSSHLICSFDAPALRRASIDCVVAPFLLELFHRNINPLNELDRILKPCGYFIFLGINPLSIWGVYNKLGLLSCLGASRISLVSPYYLINEMEHRGYHVQAINYFFHTPPFKKKEWIKKAALFNFLGKKIKIIPGNFYFLILKKNQSELRLLWNEGYEQWSSDALPLT